MSVALERVYNNCNLLESVTNFFDQNENLVEKKVSILCFDKLEGIRNNFSFPENGFEYLQFKDSLGKKTIEDVAYNPNGKRETRLFTRALCSYLEKWGKEQGLDFDLVVPLSDFAYRDANPNNKSGEKPFFLAHVDINKDKLGEIWKTEKKEFKANIEFGIDESITEKAYYQAQPCFIEFVNVWMSLNLKQTSNTLAVVDSKSLNSEDLVPHLFNEAQILSPKSETEAKWVALKHMDLGEGIIFKSTQTAHSAFDLPLEIAGCYYRKSCEQRFGFMKLPG